MLPGYTRASTPGYYFAATAGAFAPRNAFRNDFVAAGAAALPSNTLRGVTLRCRPACGDASPFSAPKTKPALIICGTTATHFACSSTSGIPLSGAAMISWSTPAALSGRSVDDSRFVVRQPKLTRASNATNNANFFTIPLLSSYPGRRISASMRLRGTQHSSWVRKNGLSNNAQVVEQRFCHAFVVCVRCRSGSCGRSGLARIIERARAGSHQVQPEGQTSGCGAGRSTPSFPPSSVRYHVADHVSGQGSTNVTA